MRILMCNFEYPPLGGGGGIICADLAAELAKRHEVTVLTSQAFDLPGDEIKEGVRIFRVPVAMRNQQMTATPVSMLSFVLHGVTAGREILKREPFDLVNTHFVLPTGPVGDHLARLGNIPNVLSLHGGDLYDPSKMLSPHRHLLLRAWIRRLLRRADRVIGQSQDTLQNMRRYYTPELEGLRIPLGIRRPAASTACRERYGFPQDALLLVTVARLVLRKALDQLLDVFATLRQYENVNLVIIGTGPQERALRQQAADRGIGDCVHFLGHVAEAHKFEILQLADLYVSTSQHEGFGLVFLEAMACALPIVCYDKGGQRDFLVSQKTGFVVPLNNQEIFVERCRQILSNHALRSAVSKYNRQRVEDYYIDRCADRYQDVFQEVIKRR